MLPWIENRFTYIDFRGKYRCTTCEEYSDDNTYYTKCTLCDNDICTSCFNENEVCTECIKADLKRKKKLDEEKYLTQKILKLQTKLNTLTKQKNQHVQTNVHVVKIN